MRWKFDSSSLTLIIYIVSASEDRTIGNETRLPWLDSVDYTLITNVIVDTKDEAGVEAKIAPTTLNSWFKNYSGLQSFDGRGFDVSSTTSFVELFNGALWLNSVDLSGWEMPASSGRSQMFAGCTSLARLTVTKKAILVDTSFDNKLGNRTAANLSWDASVGGWFGTVDNIARRYPANTDFDDILGDEPITYTWHPNQYAGRFSNDNAWWKFADNTLTIGTDSGNNKQVTETSETQPWLKDTWGKTIVQKKLFLQRLSQWSHLLFCFPVQILLIFPLPEQAPPPLAVLQFFLPVQC